MSADGPARATLTVVIPCWNDDRALSESLAALGDLHGILEVIVADASDTGAARAAAEAAGTIVVSCPKPNRGAQMNAGAAAARGSVLLFHHADSVLTQSHVDALHAAVADESLRAGAFYRKFDGRHPWLRWLEPVARLLNKHGGTLYGDQSIFVRRDHFAALGGYSPIPLMEDVEFSRRLRRSGGVVVLDPPLSSSARKHTNHGAWTTTLQNGLLLLLFRLGTPPDRLHRWYYRGKRAAG